MLNVNIKVGPDLAYIVDCHFEMSLTMSSDNLVSSNQNG